MMHERERRESKDVGPAATEAPAPAAPAGAAVRPPPLSPTLLLGLQRSAGNATTSRMLTVPPGAATHPAAEAMERPDVRFRVPTFADLKAAYTSKTLKIPEKAFQERVGELLGRMQREKRLKSSDPVPTLLSKIFPAPGVIDQAEFEKTVDVADRSVIYQSVLDADTQVKAGDKAKLQTAMSDAADLIKVVEADSKGLKEVFGTKAAVAKGHYAKARAALGDVSKDMDAKVSTDYNLDDPEVFLGGWANHGARHMHLLVGIVKVIDAKESKTTLIHEAAHLADPSIDDHGYYDTPNFEALDESIKVANAGHYEELPRRVLGTSSYPGLTFKPGVKKGGGAVTWEDTIRRRASEYLRKAWDAAVDTHTWIRRVRKAQLAGDKTPFTTNKALILEVSKLENLSVHEQDPANAEITALDVTLTESIARGVGLVGQIADSIAVQHPMGPFMSQADEDAAAEAQVIHDAVQKYGELRKDWTKDKALLDWFVAHYRSLP
jgi:hypothetical protein